MDKQPPVINPLTKEALLFSIQVRMKERNPQTRIDFVYPFTKFDENKNAIETLIEPPKYDVKFLFLRTKK